MKQVDTCSVATGKQERVRVRRLPSTFLEIAYVLCCGTPPPSPYLAGVPIFQLLLRAHCCSFSCQLPPLPFSHAGPTRWNDVGAHTCTPLASGQGSPMADAQSRAPLGSDWGSSQVYRTQMYAWVLSLLPPVSYTSHWRQLPQEIASKGIPVSSSPSREFVLTQSLNDCFWEYRETYQILSWVFINFLMYSIFILLCLVMCESQWIL